MLCFCRFLLPAVPEFPDPDEWTVHPSTFSRGARVTCSDHAQSNLARKFLLSTALIKHCSNSVFFLLIGMMLKDRSAIHRRDLATCSSRNLYCKLLGSSYLSPLFRIGTACAQVVQERSVGSSTIPRCAKTHAFWSGVRQPGQHGTVGGPNEPSRINSIGKFNRIQQPTQANKAAVETSEALARDGVDD